MLFLGYVNAIMENFQVKYPKLKVSFAQEFQMSHRRSSIALVRMRDTCEVQGVLLKTPRRITFPIGFCKCPKDFGGTRRDIYESCDMCRRAELFREKP